jgi:hypothetical protein
MLRLLYMQKLTEVCRTNGGVYVKAGQFAAAFGAVPPEYRQHLALLQVCTPDGQLAGDRCLHVIMPMKTQAASCNWCQLSMCA